MAAILKSVLSMSVATTLSRITGFARWAVQATVLGTGMVANAYTLSNTLPNQIYELFMGGLLSSIFIPLLVERLSKYGDEDARRLTNALLTIIVPLLSIVAVLGIVFAAPLVALTTAWGNSTELSPQEAQETTALAVLLFRVFALQILFYGIGTLMIGILNSHRYFFLPTFAPVLNNLVVIASFGGYWWLVSERPVAAIYVLAGGTTLGVAVMSLVLLPSVLRLGYRPRLQLGHPALGAAARLAGPMLVFVASAVGVQLFAYYLGTGFNGVPQLLYAFVVFQLPYGIFAVAIATALMPELSESYSTEDTDGYRDTLSFGLRTMAFIAVPAAVGLVAFSTPIIGLLYERGEFGPQATETVSTLLSAYGIGLLGYAGYLILVRAFYSRQNTRTPAALNVGLLVLYGGLAYGLSRTDLGLVGIALAFSVAYTGLFLVLLAAMRRDLQRIDGRRLLVSFSKILVAGAAMYGVAWLGTSVSGNGTGPLERVIILAAVGSISLAAYTGVAYLLRVEELTSAVSLLRRRSAAAKKQ